MQEYDKIRNILTDAEAQAPDFDALFGGETLGVDSLRSALHTKLLNAEAKAPEFDTLFKGETLGKPASPPKIKLLPWWSIAGVAAACLAVFFLLPDKLVQETDQLGKAPTTEQVRTPLKRTIKPYRAELPKVSTQHLQNPTGINPLKVVAKNTSVQTSMAMQTDSSDEFRDTSVLQTLIKIAPTRATGLNVKSNRTVEEAYAAAKIRKARIKPDKASFGFGVNSANRLLSMVNTRTDGGFALQSVASNASNGYASLEGASVSMLRTTTASPNEWVGPDNITAAMLLDCETTYSLPINLGLTVSIPIIHDLNLITGIQYSYLANHITGSSFNLKQELHYLGIPVKLAFNMVKRGDFVVYSALGGTIEKGLAGIQTSTVDGEGSWKGKQSVQGVQASLTGQFGLSYNLNTKFLLYLEPGVAWYIPNDQPVSNRTEEPFNLNVSLGLRYKLQ